MILKALKSWDNAEIRKGTKLVCFGPYSVGVNEGERIYPSDF